MHREGFEPSQLRMSDSFTDCLSSPTDGRCVNTAIQLSNIEKKERLLMIPNESCVTAPKNLKRKLRVFLSMFRERERRSRCVNSLIRSDHYRSVFVDNLLFPDSGTARHSTWRPAA